MKSLNQLRSRVDRLLAVSLLSGAFFLLGSCDLQRMAVEQTAGVLHDGSIAMERESDIEFARDAIPASLKTVETFLVTAPENEQLLELVSKGYYSYAYGFLEGDLERAQYEMAPEDQIQRLNRRCVIHYLRSRDYGFRLLGRPGLEEAARAGDLEKLDEELKKTDAEDVPGMFWVGYGWGSAINLSQDDTDMVDKLGVVEKIMKRVESLDDTYFWGGVHFFFGVFYSSRPPMFGGDPEKAKEHFEIAMKRHGDKNLMIPYLYARFYAPQVQDKELFVKLMHRVATANLEPHPNLRLNNEIARERARWWLENVDELIL